jgi:hypothetical protein
MQEKWNQLVFAIDHLRQDVLKFKVNFIDETGFKKYIDEHFGASFQSFKDVCLTGYFGEGIANLICEKSKGQRSRIRIIIPLLNLRSVRDQKSLASLRKMQDVDVEIRINHRLHCRMLILTNEDYKGLLILGSFDFNKEGMGAERRDAGIQTQHPDLIKSALDYFNELWENKRDTFNLNEKYPESN